MTCLAWMHHNEIKLAMVKIIHHTGTGMGLLLGSLRNKLGPFKSFVMNNKAFCHLFCNPQKSFHTFPTRIIEAVNHE